MASQSSTGSLPQTQSVGNVNKYPISTSITAGPYWSGTTIGGITYTTTGNSISVSTLPAYVCFKLPQGKLPDLVFVNGKALTLGILGSKAEAAFGYKSLVFAGSLFSNYLQRQTILQYKAKTLHYCVDTDPKTNLLSLKECTNYLAAELLSEIKR